MDNIGYGRCSQCNEEYVFQDASKCAQCLSLSSPPSDNENTEEEPSAVSLDRPAAA